MWSAVSQNHSLRCLFSFELFGIKCVLNTTYNMTSCSIWYWSREVSWLWVGEPHLKGQQDKSTTEINAVGERDFLVLF
jgi:hypothetical protein